MAATSSATTSQVQAQPEADPHRVPDRRHGGGHDDALQDAPFRHLERAAEVDEVARHRLHVVHEQQHLLEERADEDDQELLCVAGPAQRMVSGTKATTGM